MFRPSRVPARGGHPHSSVGSTAPVFLPLVVPGRKATRAGPAPQGQTAGSQTDPLPVPQRATHVTRGDAPHHCPNISPSVTPITSTSSTDPGHLAIFCTSQHRGTTTAGLLTPHDGLPLSTHRRRRCRCRDRLPIRATRRQHASGGSGGGDSPGVLADIDPGHAAHTNRRPGPNTGEMSRRADDGTPPVVTPSRGTSSETRHRMRQIRGHRLI